MADDDGAVYGSAMAEYLHGNDPSWQSATRKKKKQSRKQGAPAASSKKKPDLGNRKRRRKKKATPAQMAAKKMTEREKAKADADELRALLAESNARREAEKPQQPSSPGYQSQSQSGSPQPLTPAPQRLDDHVAVPAGQARRYAAMICTVLTYLLSVQFLIGATMVMGWTPHGATKRKMLQAWSDVPYISLLGHNVFVCVGVFKAVGTMALNGFFGTPLELAFNFGFFALSVGAAFTHIKIADGGEMSAYVVAGLFWLRLVLRLLFGSFSAAAVDKSA